MLSRMKRRGSWALIAAVTLIVHIIYLGITLMRLDNATTWVFPLGNVGSEAILEGIYLESFLAVLFLIQFAVTTFRQKR